MGIRRTRNVIISAFVLLFSAVGGNAWAPSLQVPPILNEQDRTIPLSGTIRSVVVRSGSGSVAVQPGSKHVIRVHETWNYARPTVAHTLKGGVLNVHTDCPNDPIAMNKCSADLVIVSPAAVTVDADSSFGDIATKGLRGREKLATDFGDVRAVGITASSISAVTDHGEVVLDLTSAPATTAGRSNFGDVSIKVPAGTYAVDAKTDFGDVTVKGITKDGDARRRITGYSDYGDVVITRR